MSFLAPKILFWLFALPIPFIIHLWHRKTIRRVWFSSIILLKRAEQGEQSFKRLKEILLLILRTLAILFIVLAFANPVLNKKQKIVMLDDSYDMLTKTTSGTSVFELALKEARKFKSAKIILASGNEYKHNAAPKFQLFKLDIKDADYVITRTGKLNAIKGAKIIEIEGREDNFSVDSISFSSGQTADKQDTKLFAKITNHTNKPAEKIVNLYINCHQTDTLSARVYAPQNSSVITLFPVGENIKSGYVEIDSDALDIDNTKYFVIPDLPPLKVLLVGNANNNFFVKNALAPPGVNSKITVSEIEGASLPQLSPEKYNVFISNNKEALRFPNNIFAPVETTPPQNNGFLEITNIVETHPIFADPLIIKELKQMKLIKAVTPDENILKNSKVLARFSDGSPAIMELENLTALPTRQAGARQVKNLWLGFPLNQASSELVTSAIFVPFMYRMVYWVAGKPLQKCNFVSGEQVKLRTQKSSSYTCKSTRAGVEDVSHSTLNPTIEAEGIYLTMTAETPGIYEIEGIPDTKDTTVFAVNINNELVSHSGRLPDIGQSYPAKDYTLIRNWFLWLVLALLGLELIMRRRF